ncbi:MAG: YfcE family phosphodiesterase [Gemmataceae bacterium]|nr:YfcE family phosphodiesterase [Gemmataceae bacterium]
MRILLLADVHGNRAALEAVREPHDVCLFLGDLVDYGPEPGPCVDWVQRHAHHAVRGNHDHGVAQNVDVQGVGGFRFLTACTRPPTVAALTSCQRRYLADLPTSLMLTLSGKRFLLVHATPRDPMDEYAPADPEFWAPRLAGLAVDYVCVGHTHQPYTLTVNGVTVINPGSIGLPRDGDSRASYGVVDGDRIELKRVEYPVDETIQAVGASALEPTAKQMLADIYRGGAFLGRWLKNGQAGPRTTTPEQSQSPAGV